MASLVNAGEDDQHAGAWVTVTMLGSSLTTAVVGAGGIGFPSRRLLKPDCRLVHRRRGACHAALTVIKSWLGDERCCGNACSRRWPLTARQLWSAEFFAMPQGLHRRCMKDG